MLNLGNYWNKEKQWDEIIEIKRNNGTKWLKYYWFSFSFVASKHSHIYLHTQIRLIFPQQTPDGKLRTITEGPTDPKYMSISNYNRFDLVESSSYIEIWHVWAFLWIQFHPYYLCLTQKILLWLVMHITVNFSYLCYYTHNCSSI